MEMVILGDGRKVLGWVLICIAIALIMFSNYGAIVTGWSIGLYKDRAFICTLIGLGMIGGGIYLIVKKDKPMD